MKKINDFAKFISGVFDLFTVPSLWPLILFVAVSFLVALFHPEVPIIGFWDFVGFGFVFSCFAFFPFSPGVHKFFCVCFFVLSFILFYLALSLILFILNFGGT